MRSSRAVHVFVVGLAGVYLALGLMAATCSVSPAVMAARHQHHGKPHSNHNAQFVLCVWACQANFSLTFTSSAPTLSPLLVGLLFVLSTYQNAPTISVARLRARAPPL